MGPPFLNMGVVLGCIWVFLGYVAWPTGGYLGYLGIKDSLQPPAVLTRPSFRSLSLSSSLCPSSQRFFLFRPQPPLNRFTPFAGACYACVKLSILFYDVKEPVGDKLLFVWDGLPYAKGACLPSNSPGQVR